ncbi:hypothetical protein BH11BAC2_BH11BAC2_18350 [soil metagenome]
MNATFSDLSPSSRIWIFQTSRSLRNDEQELIIPLVENFLETWTAHKATLKAGVEMLHDSFLVIGVDETISGASGCSIDKLHHFIIGLEKMIQVKFFDRFRVIYREGDAVKNLSVKEFEEEVKSGKFQPTQKVFNPMIEKVEELKENFEVPVFETWLNRYF